MTAASISAASERPHLIAVDARPRAFPATGNATYLHRMLRELLTLRPGADWLFLTHRGLHPTFADVLSHPRVELHVDSGLLAKAGPLWMHGRVPALLREQKPDLFWGTLAMLPLNYRQRVNGVPAIFNFHDLTSVRAPETMPLWKRWQHKALDHRTLAQAERVICLSETTRDDIQKHMPQVPTVVKNRLRVVYPGAELAPAEATPPASPVGALRDFILCVGTLEPRKNQATLLDGYLQARQIAESELPALVFVGRRGWDEALVRRLTSGELESQGVHYLENAGDGELRWCYQKTSCVALPSLHEGFGLPVIEAHQLGRPTILADIPIFREVGGKSRFVPPRSVAGWTQALVEFFEEFGRECKRAEAVEAGTALAAASSTAPEFDAEYWSHRERARVLSDVIDEVLG